MSMVFKIASRNIWRQKKRSFLLVGAIAFGMLIITLINALTGGVVENIRVNFSHALGGHVFVSGSEYSEHGTVVYRIADETLLNNLLAQYDGVIESVTKRSQAMPTLIFGSRQAMQLVYGVDFHSEDNLLGSLTVTKGSLENAMDERALILPGPIGERLGVEPGETVLMRLETVTGQQNVGEFIVAAFIEDQEQFGVSAAYANRSYINSLLGLEPEDYQSLNMFLTSMEQIDQVGRGFRTALDVPEPKSLSELEEMSEEEVMAELFGPLHVEDITPWEGTKYSVATLNQIMEPVEAAVNVLNTVGLVIFIVLLVITMVGITNTFRMIMIERTKEIGTMRAFGMQRGSVKRIFLMEAFLLSLTGAAVGLVLAGIVVLIVGNISFDTMAALQFFLDHGHVTFYVSIGRVILNLFLIVSMSLLSAYWPAKSAAQLSPIKALSSNF